MSATLDHSCVVRDELTRVSKHGPSVVAQVLVVAQVARPARAVATLQSCLQKKVSTLAPPGLPGKIRQRAETAETARFGSSDTGNVPTFFNKPKLQCACGSYSTSEVGMSSYSPWYGLSKDSHRTSPQLQRFFGSLAAATRPPSNITEVYTKDTACAVGDVMSFAGNAAARLPCSLGNKPSAASLRFERS